MYRCPSAPRSGHPGDRPWRCRQAAASSRPPPLRPRCGRDEGFESAHAGGRRRLCRMIKGSVPFCARSWGGSGAVSNGPPPSSSARHGLDADWLGWATAPEGAERGTGVIIAGGSVWTPACYDRPLLPSCFSNWLLPEPALRDSGGVPWIAGADLYLTVLFRLRSSNRV